MKVSRGLLTSSRSGLFTSSRSRLFTKTRSRLFTNLGSRLFTITRSGLFTNLGSGLFTICAVMALLMLGETSLAEGMNEHQGVERLPYHLDSWIALAMIGAAVAIAVTLNGASARLRTLGTLLAALACLTSVVWFLLILQTGVLSSHEPSGFPTDPAKPAMLWVLALMSLGGGVFLLWATIRQNQRSDILLLARENDPGNYGLFSRYLHWITAILFISLIPMGIFATMIPEDVEWRRGYYVVHKTLGLVVLGLVALRILWHFMSPRPKLDPSLATWERVLAKVAHYGLYFLMIALPISVVMSTFAGKSSHFFFWDLPLLWEKDLVAVRPFGLMHKLLLPAFFFLLFIAHLLGALKHHFIDGQKHNIRRIVS